MFRLLPSLPAVLSCCLSLAGAQATAPSIRVGLPPELQVSVAQEVTVQPRRVETRLGTGRLTGPVTFSLLSAVNTEVTLELGDSRLVNPGAASGPLKLRKHVEQTVVLVATAPHSGTVRIRNSAGQVIAEVPYVVAPEKTLNQSASLNYSPFTGRAGVSYSVSGVPLSPLDPRWSAGLNLGVDTRTGAVNGSVNLSVNW
ncbi:hypothetical protein [Deinococcus ficus]|uniref:hypothetical protein n=1 Tax=Deinococcus ficus TaxID=317577 RepID=UPI0017480BCF|nr:hypothetical protein [Deinococcus ficus]GHF76007.1 hypothetical protein GCM10017782_12260 [Deinococcus ficus]